MKTLTGGEHGTTYPDITGSPRRRSGRKLTVVGRTINMDNVQIINGLETTTCIYNYMNPKVESNNVGEKDKERSILVKILNNDDETARDKIIKARVA